VYNLVGTGGYRFDMFGRRDATVLAGYRYMKQEYETGGIIDRFGVNWVIKGPLLALRVTF
jgi:hypothetical protein